MAINQKYIISFRRLVYRRASGVSKSFNKVNLFIKETPSTDKKCNGNVLKIVEGYNS